MQDLPGTVSTTRIDTSDNETAFVIQRRAGSGEWLWLPSLGANRTSSVDTLNLKPDTVYTYRIQSHNRGGSSAFSREASAVPL